MKQNRVKIYSTILLVFISTLLFSQKEANIWYFGENAGLDFNSGSPVALTNGQLNTREGCSTISDSNGNLLFYSDGITVYNKNHGVMMNGTGLLGDSSSTHSALIVPKPNDPNIYYIFTVDYQRFPNGLRYSEVDMTLDAGLGGITSIKNVLLHTPTTEKITAIIGKNRNEIWVVSHKWDSDEFMSFKVTGTGVNTTPVISAVGTHVGTSFRPELAHTIGAIKISPDGKKLAVARKLLDVQLFDFDDATGVVSNAITLIDDSVTERVYGLEFSPNSELLYVKGEIQGQERGIFQYNLKAGLANDILLSRIEITGGEDPRSIGALQLGPDGKIYLTRPRHTYLDAINNPNELGLVCDYQKDVVFLDGRIAQFGLPPFIQSFFHVNFDVEELCFGDLTQFSANISDPYDSLLWDFGDGTTSTLENPTHTYAAPGDYTISLSITIGTQTITETNEITIVALPTTPAVVTLQQCDDDTDGFSQFNLNEAIPDITPNPNSVTITFHPTENDARTVGTVIPNPTTYTNQIVNTDNVWARIENSEGCFSITRVALVVSTTQIPLTYHKTIQVCDDATDGDATNGIATFDLSIAHNEIRALFPVGQTITITYYTDINAALEERDAITDITNYSNTSSPVTQAIYVRVDDDQNRCIGIGEHIQLQVDPAPVAYPITDDILCNATGTTTFTLSDYNALVLNGQSNTVFEVLYFDSMPNATGNFGQLPNSYPVQSGTATLYARVQNQTNTDCYAISSFDIGVYQTPTAQQPDDMSVWDDANNDGVEVFNLDHQTPTILNGQSGADFEVSYHITPNDAQTYSNPLVGSTFENTTSPQIVYARVQNRNHPDCYSTTSFTVIVASKPTLDMPDTWPVCENGSVTLIATPGFDTYLWSTGTTESTLTVSQIGMYTVVVTQTVGDLFYDETKTVTVVKSDVPVIKDIKITDWTQNHNSIEVITQVGFEYEYSLDGVTYQDDPRFTNVDIGNYTVYVRDKNGCGTTSQEVFLFFYPQYFTPNGDGFHDTWQIYNAHREPDIKTYIFDRLGKLLAQLGPNDLGWDGTMNGRPMPSSEYWFLVERQDGSTHKGHFSLIR